jgi:ribosomal protein S12 methylthiotransferase accessory factor
MTMCAASSSPEQDAFTHMPISTGLAAGRAVQPCIDKGLCEIVERDALMIVWNARIPAPRVDPSSCLGVSDKLDRLLGSVQGPRSAWHLNLLTLDVELPVISAALIDDGAPPLTSFGIAARTDPVAALESALEEALLTRLLVNRSSDVQAGGPASGEAVRTLRDHLVAHASSVELRDRMRFLTDDGPLVTLGDVRARYSLSEPIVALLARAGLEGCWVDITTPDVADLGFVVTRSLIAGMQPLDNDHAHRHLGGARLWTVPRHLGHAMTSLNPDPHPFP